MIKIEIDSWKLQELARANPELYNNLREHTLKKPYGSTPLKEIEMKPNKEGVLLAEVGWQTFESHINAIEDVHPDLLGFVTFKPIARLNMLTDSGSINRESVLTALGRNQIHLPDNLLLQVKTVYAMANSCTEEIQAEIEQGAKIIAVLPQPGQRRPDYILGRL